MLTYLATNTFSSTHKAFTIGAKQIVDVNKNEVMRAARATNSNTVEVLSMTIPTRIGGFNQDYYPPFAANEPSNTAEDWTSGVDVEPKTMQLSLAPKAKMGKQGGLSRLKTGIKAAAAVEESKGGDNSAELAELRAKVESLERELSVAQGSGASAEAEDFNTMPVLGYWAIRGLGHPIRMMFYYVKQNFADRTYECGDAPDFDKSSWTDVKETLGFEFPNLPYLIDGEVKLTETAAIMQYIAKKWRPALLGKNSYEVGRINMLWAHVSKLKEVSTFPCYMGDGNAEPIIQDCQTRLAKIVEVMGDSQFIIGDNLTWLDFYFAENLDMLNALSDGFFYSQFPSLQAYWDRFIFMDGLAEAWADDTKLMKAPFNNK